MLNQVEFEGYLTRAWEHRGHRYMRLANHRPGENGKTMSDYVIGQIDPSLNFDPRRLKVGRLLRVTGRIVGRDIVKPLRLGQAALDAQASNRVAKFKGAGRGDKFGVGLLLGLPVMECG